MSDFILLLVSFIISYPLSHLFMKKGMELDFKYSESRHKDLTKFFYVPIVNALITFLYLVWMVIIFKRPE